MLSNRTEKRQPVSARRRIEERYQPGRPLDFIGHAQQVIRPGDLVVIVSRVSERIQKWNKNLGDQVNNLRHRVEELGAIVVDVVEHVGSGCDPSWLWQTAAVFQARGAKMIAESVDRFIRPRDYSNRNQDAQATQRDLESLREWTLGITLVTDLEPSASPGEVRAYQTKRGQTEKLRSSLNATANITLAQLKLRKAVCKVWKNLPRMRA